MNAWKEHHGGVIPESILQNDKVMFKRRDGSEFTTTSPHSWSGWEWKGREPNRTDIVGYRKDSE